LIKAVWGRRPPYKLLDCGSANGLTLKAFEDESFDFVYETCLRYLPENSIDDAIRELFRICRIGVVCGSIATDMTREIIDAEDLFYGVETFASMWEWGECSGDLGPGRPPAGLEDREEIKRRGGALVSGR
jgi:hypothetical protein